MAIAGGLTEEQLQQVLPSRVKKGGETKVVAKEELKDEPLQEIGMEIASPAHLWGLGHITLKTGVPNLQEAAALVGEAQTFFQNLEKGYSERIEAVKMIQNQITVGQMEMIESLAEEVGEDVPDDLENMSKTAAGNLIRELLAKSGGRSETRQGGSRRGKVGSGEARRGAARYGKARFSKSRRFRDDGGDDEITPAQRRYLKSLGADEDEYKDLSKSEASKLIKQLKEDSDEDEED